jgi:hypothetical protein
MDFNISAEFQMDDIVDVASRCWVGINKPGGVGKIIKINKCDGTSILQLLLLLLLILSSITIF